MKKFNLRGVLDGIRSTVGSGGGSGGGGGSGAGGGYGGNGSNSTPRTDLQGIEETLASEHFQVAKVWRLYLCTDR